MTVLICWRCEKRPMAWQHGGPPLCVECAEEVGICVQCGRSRYDPPLCGGHEDAPFEFHVRYSGERSPLFWGRAEALWLRVARFAVRRANACRRGDDSVMAWTVVRLPRLPVKFLADAFRASAAFETARRRVACVLSGPGIETAADRREARELEQEGEGGANEGAR